MTNQIAIDVIFNAINKTGNVLGQVNRGLNGMMNNMWRINQAADLMGRMNSSLERLSGPATAFNYGLAEMSAITGTVGNDLDQLGKVARRVGKESGLGATGAIEAFKLLASQIEVDKIGMDGLIELHKRTVTLVQASPELGMAGAANALAGTINQFGLEASQAGRVMNVLAAGSKYGAAEIPDLAQSFKVVGASAAAAGLSVEATGGAIEILSKNNIKGSEAGTALRNVLLKMQTDLGFDFKVTKLSDALATLKDKAGDAAYMSKIFGMENITAAQFLVKNAAEVDEMTKKMTDTSVATEQANIMNNTFNHRMQVMKARLNDLSIGFFKSNEGILQWVQLGGQGAMMITTMTPLLGVLGKGLVGTFMGFSNTVKATRLLGAALKAGKFETYSALISRYGMAGRVAAGGIWLKNQAVSSAVFIGKLFNAQTRGAILLQMRQAFVSRIQAAWTWMVSKAQAVAGAFTALWGKRIIITSALQAGWNKILALSKLSMAGMLAPMGGVIASTWAWTAALFANPITWIVAGVMALVAAILLAWKHFDGFRGVLVGAWEAVKQFGVILFDSIINPIKLMLQGIGKLINAFQLLKKKDFSGAWQATKEGFGDIGSGLLKGSPIGVVSNVIQRRDEISNAASGGYARGKAMDTSNFLKFGNKKEQPITAADMQIPQMEAVNLPGKMNMAAPDLGMMQIPAELNMRIPQMSAVNLPGKLDVASPDHISMQNPGSPAAASPGINRMAVPERQGKDYTNTRPQPNYVLRPEYNQLDQATKNITQNIVNNQNRTQNQNQNQNSKIEVVYQPQIHISAEMTRENQESLLKMLYQHKEQVTKMVKEELRKEGRLNYAG